MRFLVIEIGKKQKTPCHFPFIFKNFHIEPGALSVTFMLIGGVIIIEFWNFDPKVGEMVH